MATNLVTASPIESAQAAGPRSLLQRFIGALVRIETQSRTYFELTQMTSRELADLGLRHSDIPNVVSGNYQRG
jgi:uncharacterized protein YjiS (DUF1127 family)